MVWVTDDSSFTTTANTGRKANLFQGLSPGVEMPTRQQAGMPDAKLAPQSGAQYGDMVEPSVERGCLNPGKVWHFVEL